MSGRRRATLDHLWPAAVPWADALPFPNVLARADLLYMTPTTTGLAGARLATAAYAVANYVIGSALMQVGAQDDTSGAAEHLARSRDLYPALAEHGHLDDGDWDAAFVQGLDYLLDGIGGVISR